MERRARINTKSAWKKIVALFSKMDQSEGITDHGMKQDAKGIPYHEFEVDGEHFGVFSLRSEGNRYGGT